MYINPILLIYPSPTFLSGNQKFVSYGCKSVLFFKEVYLHYFLDSTNEWYHIIFIFLQLT